MVSYPFSFPILSLFLSFFFSYLTVAFETLNVSLEIDAANGETHVGLPMKIKQGPFRDMGLQACPFIGSE